MSTAPQHLPESMPPLALDSNPKIRVLMIDDDPAYQHLCRRYLEKIDDLDYELVTVATAEEGVSECQKAAYDCLLIDYTLPDVTGTQVFLNLSAVLKSFTPPAIILTANGGQYAAADAVRSGASDFMIKGTISAQSLSRAIFNVVEKDRLRSSVRNRSTALQEANENLQKKNDEIQRFYQGVSHEVKTPLAAAREFIAIVMDGLSGPVTAEQTEILSHALDSCDQITAHFNDLIEMTRLDAEKIKMKLTVGSLESVVTRCLAAITTSIDAKNIQFFKRIESPLPLVRIDSNRVIQVLSNLLGNAIKYTDPNRKITLSISHCLERASIVLSVSDTGRGIAAADLPHVFERLFQVEEGGDELMGAGLGLGLSIAREIVALHGGKMWVESELHHGSTFSFSIPTAHSILDIAEKQSENSITG